MSLLTIGLVLYHPYMNKVGPAEQVSSLRTDPDTDPSRTYIRTQIQVVDPAQGSESCTSCLATGLLLGHRPTHAHAAPPHTFPNLIPRHSHPYPPRPPSVGPPHPPLDGQRRGHGRPHAGHHAARQPDGQGQGRLNPLNPVHIYFHIVMLVTGYPKLFIMAGTGCIIRLNLCPSIAPVHRLLVVSEYVCK